MRQISNITVHCLIKNEENFISYAIRSVIDYVDNIIVFDTGSTDKTVDLIKSLAKEYPNKIIFQEKGECDKKSHTALRQEMIEITTTKWFMTLDGDEIWTEKGMEEMIGIINSDKKVECLIVPYYLCVGDVYHYSKRGKCDILNNNNHHYPRCFKMLPGVHWGGDYGEGDCVLDKEERELHRRDNTVFLKNKYWHASALVRSSKDQEINLGRNKQVMTYSLKILGEGFRIKENLPEIICKSKDDNLARLSLIKSWRNLIVLVAFKIGLYKKRYL